MLKKHIYLAAIISTISMSTAFAANVVKVEATVELQVGNKVKKSTVIIGSEEYTQLSMENESLGFALKLKDAQVGNERFETTPTRNGQPIAKFFYSGKQTILGAGCNLNGQVIDKELVVKFLVVKHLS